MKISSFRMMFPEAIVFIGFLVKIAECKYCQYKTSFGKSNHVYCSAFQFCCGEKCCENIDEFYKLWYFWFCLMILMISLCAAFYWLHQRCLTQQMFLQYSGQQQRLRHHGRGSRRYRHLTGDSTVGIPFPAVIPESVVISPPSYTSDNTGCPHSGPPPYSLGSGSSINSTNLPRFPPSYAQIEKQPPPSYSTSIEVCVQDTLNKQKPSDCSLEKVAT